MSPSEIQLVIDELRMFAVPKRPINAMHPFVPSDLANWADGLADRLEDQLPDPAAATFDDVLSGRYPPW
jgi:hypothetical protein